jgi:hypothetical protein
MAIEWITLTDETIINDLKLFNKEVPQTEISHLEKISMICPRYNNNNNILDLYSALYIKWSKALGRHG